MRFSKIVYLICCLAVLMIFSSARIASGEESAVQSSREEESNAKVLDNPVPITVEFRDTDIKDVLRSIAEICQVNIVSADNVKGKITISLKEVKLKDALEAILSVNKYAWRPQGEKIIIVEALPALTTKFIQLKYAEAAKMKELLDGMKSDTPGSSLLMDPRANKLIIRDYPEKIAEFEKVVTELDVAPAQVTINAKIIEITLKDVKELGIQMTNAQYETPTDRNLESSKEFDKDSNDNDIGTSYHNISTRENTKQYGVNLRKDNTVYFVDQNGDISGSYDPGSTFQYGNSRVGSESRTNSYINPISRGMVTSIITGSIADGIFAQLDALITQNKTLLLAAPTITTLNNETASIIIGEKVGIKEQTQTTTGTTETTRFQDVGTKLEVTPQINVDGYITMTIKPEVSNVKQYTSEGITFTTSEARTKVRVRDGDTVIIGGLIRNQNDKEERRIPYLSRIPLMGWFFKGKSDEATQKELVVFLSPTLMKQGYETYQSSRALEQNKKLTEESKAKEKELLEKFGYDSKWTTHPATEIGESKVLAKQIYKDALTLERKGRRMEDPERRKKIFEMAIDKYKTIPATYPDSREAPEALYHIGLIQSRYLNDSASAGMIFDELMEKYPQNDLYRKAKKEKTKLK